MNIEFNCPQCGQQLTVDEAYRGQVVQCPKCEKGIVVPRGKPKLGVKRSVGVPQNATSERTSGGNGGDHITIPRRFQQSPEFEQLRASYQEQAFKPGPPPTDSHIPPKSRGSKIRKTVNILYIILGIAIGVAVASYGGYLYFGDAPRLERGIAHYENKAYAKAIKLLLPLAKKGHAKAQLYVGDCYANGNGVFMDTEEAVKWYRAAADQDLPEALYRMFVCCRDGVGMTRNRENAAKWCRKAANAGVADAMFDMGGLYISGIGVEKNEDSAFRWYRKGAERGHAYSLYQFGLCYKLGLGTKKDEDEASKWQNKAVAIWRTNANAGDTEAMVVLANLYMDGKVVELDKEEAVRWFRKAAELGNAAAQFRLATCYHNGDGVDKDAEEAAKWMLKSAEQGKLSESQWAMGRFYEDGKGVEKDMSSAIKWFERAAKKGSSLAKLSLAMCYLHGEGMPQDVAKAESLFQEIIADDDEDEEKEGEDDDSTKEQARKELRRIRQEREERARRLTEVKAEKESKIKKLSEMEDEIEERKARINSILNGTFMGNRRSREDWRGFDAGKITMTDASVNVTEEQPLRRVAESLSDGDSMEKINNSLVVAQKEMDRLEGRLKEITRVKSIYDAKELESRKEKCPPCNGLGSITCARCKGAGELLAKGRVTCPACDGEKTISGKIICNRCNGAKWLKPKCTTCNGSGMVRNNGVDEWGKRRLDNRERCSSCGGSGRGTQEACPKCDATGRIEVEKPCQTCRGQGVVARDNKVTCPICDGKCKLKCERCDGRGFTYRPKDVDSIKQSK